MVTKLKDGRGQLTLKGKEVTDEWEKTIKHAAACANMSVTAWIVAVTSQAAGQPSPGQQLGDRLDRLGRLAQQLETLMNMVSAVVVERRAQHQELLDHLRRIERQASRRHR